MNWGSIFVESEGGWIFLKKIKEWEGSIFEESKRMGRTKNESGGGGMFEVNKRMKNVSGGGIFKHNRIKRVKHYRK